VADINDHFNPNYATPPGDTIYDIMQERGITKAELGHALHLGLREVTDLIDGKRRITLGIANMLAEYLGASFQFWMLRDYNYLEKLGELEHYRGTVKPVQHALFSEGEDENDF